MRYLRDIHKRQVRLTDERLSHIESEHPEMSDQINNVRHTLSNPDLIVRSKTDSKVELFYKHYKTTPVTEKYLCVVVKVLFDDLFIITVYFTDAIKER